MSVRLSRAEGCLQTLENDEEIFPHNSEGFDDFDAVIPDNWTEEDKKVRIKLCIIVTNYKSYDSIQWFGTEAV